MSSNKFNQEIISKTEKTFFQKLVSEQSFWVSIALLGICFMMFFVEDAFSSKDNLFNITSSEVNTSKLFSIIPKIKIPFSRANL